MRQKKKLVIKKHRPTKRPTGQTWASQLSIWDMAERQLSKAPWGPTVLPCSGALEPDELEKWGLLCVFLSPLFVPTFKMQQK